ncbi:MAG TPA: hypothetical protein VF414_22060 [Thermoanaerobaculia bacterium]
MPEYRMRAVVFKEGDWWVAQCLEYDFAAVSKDLEELPGELQWAVTAQITISLERGIQPFHGYSPAPRRFWEMFERAQTLQEPSAANPSIETRLAA